VGIEVASGRLESPKCQSAAGMQVNVLVGMDRCLIEAVAIVRVQRRRERVQLGVQDGRCCLRR
jgi:hypothetical protein